MIGKAYWGALIIADSEAQPRPKRAEVFDHAWVDSDEFQKRIATNVPDKLAILQRVWQKLAGEKRSACGPRADAYASGGAST